MFGRKPGVACNIGRAREAWGRFSKKAGFAMVLENNMEQFAEKRRYERLPKEVDIHFGMFQDLSEVVIDQEGRLLDIGVGGVRFLASEHVEVASQIMLILEFPGWQGGAVDWQVSSNESDIGVLKVLGMVVRCLPSSLDPDSYEVGVCFCGRMKK